MFYNMKLKKNCILYLKKNYIYFLYALIVLEKLGNISNRKKKKKNTN